MDIKHSIDGVRHGYTTREPDNLGLPADYDQLLCNVTGLKNAQHTLTVDLLGSSGLRVGCYRP